MAKYYYEEGMCHVIGYKGQYPIAYTSEDGQMYNKECMSCNAIANSNCTIHKTCKILLLAPESMENNWKLRDKKMG